MGYAHGIEWTDEKVIDAIQEIMDKLDLKTFPTKTEIKSYFHNTSLQDRIARTGGVRYWAERLNLPIKDCETKTGELFEQHCLCYLEELGYNVCTMKSRYPYDLSVNNNIKVDVKSGYMFHNYGNGEYFTFNLEKSYPTCDIFVVYCLNDDKSIAKTFVIPSVFLFGKTQLALGKNKSKYDKFIDRWDYFEKYDKFYSNLIRGE